MRVGAATLAEPPGGAEEDDDASVDSRGSGDSTLALLEEAGGKRNSGPLSWPQACCMYPFEDRL